MEIGRGEWRWAEGVEWGKEVEMGRGEWKWEKRVVMGRGGGDG